MLTIHRDVAEYCCSCDACQSVATHAPLIPPPVIEQPLERIAMDIVGPLPRSTQGSHFVLVACDYATRYPETVLMKHIDAASVAEELIKIFT